MSNKITHFTFLAYHNQFKDGKFFDTQPIYYPKTACGIGLDGIYKTYTVNRGSVTCEKCLDSEIYKTFKKVVGEE